MTSANKAVRCAIYTRVSTDSGLDQEFNSLDAQYDAASAYIRSQAHAHWTLVRTRYDDGGFSGGSTDRPALQNLLADVKARKINVIVVYKVDRLTRSLADFAKLVELFDAHGVSFVSVTQQFNTTTSMGRLTLNVLLSFAQFEREVTSERIRDKIAASKRKGLWVGGMVPLGYELKDGKLTIVEKEAELVRTIFRRYLELGSVNRLVADLGVRKARSKIRTLSNGQTRGGVPFTQGPLFYMLRNRFYIGEVRFKNEICPGPQPPLMDRGLFDAVQARLSQQWSHRTATRTKSGYLLSSLLFDDAGFPMVATHATKDRVRYRYYVSQAILRGSSKTPCGSVSRVPAADIETVVAEALAKHLGKGTDGAGNVNGIDRKAVVDNIARIEIRKNQIAVRFKSPAADEPPNQEAELMPSGMDQNDAGSWLLIPWRKPPSKQAREILLPASAQRHQVRPIKAERKAALIRAIARGRAWLDEIVSGTARIEQIATRNKRSLRHVNMTISMAFIAPALVKAAIEGRLPRGIGVASLREAPAEWSRQYERLGLPIPD
ncbi:MAG: recombinase family protein [Pseudorhodoplanes sp.]|uniref:recombinase family protein n=1 Tax=Pseudorhodoplanes sp. TaxID=1934341 RepID=UPI003D1398D7